MKEWFALALHPSVVKRAFGYAIIVGAILISINHGDAILHGQMTRSRVIKMALTVLVPYIVSTLSSVAAMRERNDDYQTGRQERVGPGR